MAVALERRKFSGLKMRILSGVVLGPLTLAVIVAGSWPLIMFMAVAFVIALREWINLCVHAPDCRHASLFSGAVYLTLCFLSYAWLRFHFEQGAWLGLSLVVTIWASDIGAYFTGKNIGGPKMAPKISPNKTWAGLGGAIFFSGLMLTLLFLLGEYFSRWLATDIGLRPGNFWAVFLTGCVLGLIGQVGDLFKSIFKRRAGVKDSGSLIPGHGGLLDRIDSLLLAVPVFSLILSAWLP